MRGLTDEELSLISGGGDIVVTAPYPTPPPPYIPPPPSSPPPPPPSSPPPPSGGGGGSGGGGAYASNGVSAAANHFADSSVHKSGNTATDEHDFELAHDGVAKFYDYAKANPNALIDIGNGKTITATQALDGIARAAIVIADTGGGATGANTAPDSNYNNYAITINTQNTNIQGYANGFGDGGIDYVIFHELGHVLNDVYNRSVAETDEAAANSAGRSLENAAGIPLMAVPPTNGYD